MKKLPFLLIISRVFLALLIALIAFQRGAAFRELIVTLIVVGLLTDVLDGIVARRVGVSTASLRAWDSNVDLFFWAVVIGVVFALNPLFLHAHFGAIISVIGLEALAYAVSFLKFRRTIATHSLLAKFWTLTLLAFMVDLTLHATSSLPFMLCIGLGLLSRLEILGIILRLRRWTTDIPTIFAVGRLNRGEPVRKSRWFNG